jgi:ATP synthase subunit 6
MNNLFLFSPLEQFQIRPILSLKFGIFDFSITNATIILFLVFFITLLYILSIIDRKDKNVNVDNFTIVPSRIEAVFEMIFNMILSLANDNIKHKENAKFFPLVFFLFMFITSLNSIGLIPYSFTLTSHIVVTLGMSLAIFIGINIICFRKHGIHFFSLFLPPGTSIALAFLLVPIELISYVFKPISLSIRLFANMMAGHTLLKVIAGFAFTLMNCTGILFLAHYGPLLILVPLFALELAVALIQAFVFSILICIYLNDALNLH